MRHDTVKGVLENFHASTPHFAVAFPRCENVYRKKKENKRENGSSRLRRNATNSTWRH